jgi:uncharacterized protein YgiM (DUF1202 family)
MKPTNTWLILVYLGLALILMGGCVTTAPLPSTMYINPAVTYLRNGPSLESGTLVELTAGDQMDVLEATDTGWCKVRSVRTNVYGWVPKDLLAAAPPPPKPVTPAVIKPSLPKLYVAVKSVNLREQPSNRANSLKELEFNSKVEKLGENEQGWVQVRVTEGNITGWIHQRYLEGYMLPKPRVFTKPRGAGAGPKKAEEAAPDAM